MHWRPRFAHGGRVLLLTVSIVGLASAQETKWKELSAQVEQLQKQGKYADALPVAQEALQVAEATFGSEHTNTANALNNLRDIQVALGKYAEAEPFLSRSLELKEKGLGPESIEVAQIDRLSQDLVYLIAGFSRTAGKQSKNCGRREKRH